jgi:hypothetical protein
MGLNATSCSAWAAVILALSACAQQTGAKSASASEQACLFDSAEAYENLTEKSFTADAQSLGALAVAAEEAARACATDLGIVDADALSTRFTTIDAALLSNDRAGVARNAVEAYRIFVTVEYRKPDGIPLQVSLLDYAGFRMQADLQSEEPDWADFVEAASFADQQWSEIEAKVTDAGLSQSVAAELGRIRAAATDKNVPAAKEAVTSELDQVDQLERHFSR